MFSILPDLGTPGATIAPNFERQLGKAEGKVGNG